jgi:hypothetical protein
MAFVQTLFWKTVVDLISTAKNITYVALPSIDEELSDLLVSLKRDRNVVIKVCVDNSEDAIRNGYGEAKGIDNLINNEIILKESKGNRVSFIIIDSKGFVLFPESRIFSAHPTGPNAIELDAFTISRLIAYYFPPENIFEKEQLQERFESSFEAQKTWLNKINSEIEDQKGRNITTDFREDAYAKTKEALTKIPPIEPDLQRRIKTYTAKVQFVELKFSGINLQARTINIPKDAIPINNAELKNLLLTKMKLFQNMGADKGFAVFGQLKKKVEVLREDYLKPITCREGKSLIQVEMKEAFKGRLQKIKQEIQDINKQLPDILETATLQTKDLIKAELLNFFRLNQPDEIKQYNDSTVRERKLIEFVDRIVYRIPFPKTKKLIEKISLNDYYYDLTFQDFSDDKLIQELQKKDIMKDEDFKGIVEMKNAFAEKR